MKIYEFTVIVNEVEGDTADSLYGCCNDASLGKSNGRSYVAFDREAASLEAAIDSALSDLRNTGIQPLRLEMDVEAATV